MDNTVQQRQLLDVYTAARILGLSHWTLRNWAYRGVVASHKISTRLMFDEAEIQRVIRESERPALVQRKAS
jgi:predicted site-specific integrase-resolvase